ncbi:MAG: hypothetical protein KatS3mg115_0975 [Candidatus Poribacteria bacterium]|nr:MAG: hypothetical protein KatS3mg115_0975 [Candidatus Poribacteria bacterium]
MIRFAFLPPDASEDETDLPVEWVSRLPDSVPRHHLGQTSLVRPDESRFQVRMRIGLYDRITGRRLDEARLLTVCLHELGHALGLWGHSPHAEDVMAAASGATRPTPRDAATLRKLYELPVNAPLHDRAVPLAEAAVRRNPEDAGNWYRLGSILLDAGEAEQAVLALEEAFRRNADDETTVEKLVRAYLALGDLRAAQKAILRAGRANPAALNNLGAAYVDRGEQDQAITLFRQALELDPEFGPARRNLARLLAVRAQESAQAGEADRAIADLQEAYRLYPERIEFALRLGHLLAEQGRYEEAIPLYRQAQERGVATEKSLAACYNGLGVRRLGERRWQAAVEAFRAAIRWNPGSEPIRNNLEAARWQWALELVKTDPVAALEVYRDGRSEAELSPQQLGRLGVLLLEGGWTQEAVETLRRAHQASPEDPLLRANLGAAYYRLGLQQAEARDYAAAVEAFQAGIALNPEDLSFHKALGLAYQEMGNFKGAVDAFQTILERRPGDPWATAALTNLALRQGNEAYQRRDYPAAVAAFERVPKEQRTAPLYSLLGYLYMELENWPKAIDALGRAQLLDPQEETSRTNFEYALNRLKRDEGADRRDLLLAEAFRLAVRIVRSPEREAVEPLLQLIRQAPEDPVLLEVLADCSLSVARALDPHRPAAAREVAELAVRRRPEAKALAQWIQNRSPQEN